MLKHQKYWLFLWHCDMNNFLTESWILTKMTKLINTELELESESESESDIELELKSKSEPDTE